jgi:hypothetical protein
LTRTVVEYAGQAAPDRVVARRASLVGCSINSRVAAIVQWIYPHGSEPNFDRMIVDRLPSLAGCLDGRCHIDRVNMCTRDDSIVPRQTKAPINSHFVPPMRG